MRCHSKQYKYKRSCECIRRKKRTKSRRRQSSHDSFLSPSGVDLDNLSEIIRINRRVRSEGKGSWKVLPRDSRDLYNKYEKRRKFPKKDIKNKRKSEKPRTDSKTPRNKSLRKSKKLIRKRRYWRKVNSRGKRGNPNRTCILKRTNKKSYRRPKHET